MKKGLLLFAGVAFMLALGLTSCKKDYTCECTYKDSAGTVVSTMTTSITMHNTKSKAKDACEVSVTSGGYTSSCELK